MFILSLGAICVNPTHSRSIINEQSENDSIVNNDSLVDSDSIIGNDSIVENDSIAQKDSIENIISKIDLPVIHIITEDSIEPSCKNIMHPEGCLGQSITDNNYVKGEMTIHKDSILVYSSGKYVKKESGMRIKVRGNTSADFPYKSFKIKTEIKTDLLNRDDDKYKNKSWVLLNIYSTRDLRTVTGFYLGELVRDEWEPKYQFVNLFINGEYRGLYMLAESIGYSEGRCNLSDPTGLLIEADAYWWKEDEDEPVIKTDHLPYAIGYTFKNPELSVDDPTLDRIKDYLNAFEDSLYNNKDINDYIDLESFASWVLVHDLLGTWDGAGSNIYLKKDNFFEGEDLFKSKLEMGPLWDFDSAFKTNSQWAASHISEYFYFKELFKRPDFIIEYQDQWRDIRDDIANNLYNFIENFIDKNGKAIDESRRVSPPGPSLWQSTTEDDFNEIKNWYSERIPWLDEEISNLLQTVYIQEVNNNSRITSVTVFDMSGRICKVYRGNEAARIFNSPRYEESLSNLLNGIYIMKATYADGSTKSRRQII